MFETLLDRYVAWRGQKKCTITVYLNSPEVKHMGGFARCGMEGRKYQVHVSPGNPCVKEVLAHELGHCVESILGAPWASYRNYAATGVSDVTILKCEAYAWRFALQMFPSMDRWVIKYGHGKYVKEFKK